MQKRFMTAVALAATALLAGSASAAQAAQKQPDEPYVNSHVTLTDLATGEVLYSSTEQVPVSEVGPTTVSSPLPPEGTVQPFSSIGGTKDPGSVKSSITITYTKSGEDIRLEAAAGSWTPKFSIELKNRHVRIINGGVWPATIDKYPTGNSYNYSTGWSYVQFNNSANYVPRVMAEVDYRISGTNGTWVRLTHWVDLSGA